MKKKLRITYNAPVVLSFVIICVLVTTIGVITNHISTGLLFSIYRGSWKNPITYLRFFTHVFGHSGFEHLIGNSMYLLLLGPLLEEKYGSKVLLKVFLCTTIVTGTIFLAICPNASLCGASGIVFACIILSSFTTFRDGEVPLSFLLVVVVFIGKEMISGFMIQDNISNFTHIIGGIVGGIYGYILNRKK